MSGTAGVRFSSELKNHNTKEKLFMRNEVGRLNRNVAGLVDTSERRTEKVKAVILVML